ncbi:MAG: hypothetical protein AAF681_04915 [Pseudomonadota bacterium]
MRALDTEFPRRILFEEIVEASQQPKVTFRIAAIFFGARGMSSLMATLLCIANIAADYCTG